MGYNTAGVRIFYNYADAKDWHDKTPPIRGNSEGVRPLGSRRHWQMASMAMDGDDVVFNYYNRKAVVWHPDDSLTVYLPHYCSAYEPDKLAHFLPPKVGYEWNAKRLVLRNAWDDSRVVITSDNPVHLKADGVADWNGRIVRTFKTQELPQVFRYTKRRGAVTKIINSKLQPFLDWVDLTATFTPCVTSDEHNTAYRGLFHATTGISEQDLKDGQKWYDNSTWDEPNAARKQAFRNTYDAFESFPMAGRNVYRSWGVDYEGATALFNMLLPENQDQWLTALQIIAGQHGHRTWRDGGLYYKVERTTVQQYVEKIVCAVFKDSVFEKQQLELGSIPTKLHSEYFTAVSYPYFEKTDTVSDISV